jgi:glycine/D-amino acid oxidase-like deaminating enzyme/nitrite reductase/ring-hydroxylating ferredoxin subunit
MTALPSPRSLWIESAGEPRPPLAEDARADVAVLGGGITGLTAALLLAREGADVCLVESRRIGAGVTGHTTAKLSSLHGLSYADLARAHGDEVAHAYGEANQAGIAAIAHLAEEHGIACELGRKPNFTFAEDAGDGRGREAEVEAADRLGLPAAYADDLDLPFPVAGAVRFDNQAEFHPVKYLVGLAAALESAGGRIFEGTTAASVSEGTPCRVTTSAGRLLTAEHVIAATHFPILDRGLFFARMHPERSYVVAGEIEGEGPAGMYLSTESRAHSIRVPALADGRRRLLVGGEAHRTAQADEAERYRRLAAYASERFGMSEIAYRWASQDNMPVDSLPFVGRYHPRASRLWVATGFRKWGLAMGTSAAAMLCELAQGRTHPWAEAFAPNRLRPRAALPSLAREGANVGFHFFRDRLRRGSAEGLRPGEGRIVGSGLGQRAVHRDDAGRLHTLSARCTHLGCIVAWNGAERTWDCPCHGSRFAATGEVVQGPAVRPLRPEVEDQTLVARKGTRPA